MSLLRNTISRLDENGARQAPSTIVNACKAQAPWHFIMGFVCVAVGAALAWSSYQTLRWDEEVRVLRGLPVQLDENKILTIAGIFVLTPLLSAGAFFRCGAALYHFAWTREVEDLRLAMGRLRMVWRLLLLAFIVLMCDLPIRRYLVSLFERG